MEPSQVYEYLGREKTPKLDRDEKNQGEVFFLGADEEFIGRWVDEGHDLGALISRY